MNIYFIVSFGSAIIIIVLLILRFFDLTLKLGRQLVENGANLENEILERRKAQSQSEEALAEREILLKEIHHRVKNNMQIISSLLRMQSKRIDDPKTREIIDDSRNRINAMALIHEVLYKPSNLTQIPLKEYIEQLAHHLIDFNSIDSDRIKLILNIEQLYTNIETAATCGIIVNELLTNCLKYAFPDDRTGSIILALNKEPDDGSYLLEVSDDGIGLPRDLDIRHTSTLGMQLIVNLVEHQMRGQLTVQSANGTTFSVKFHDIGYVQRI